MNKYILSGLLVGALGAGGIAYSSFATEVSDREEIDTIVRTLTDEQMKKPEKEEHVQIVVDMDKALILNVLSDLNEIKKNNGYTGIARKRKISRARVKQIEKSVNEEKMSRLPKEVEVIEK